MKKFLFFLLTAMLTLPLFTQAQQEITIGTGTSTTYYTPFNSLWGYSFVEAIYTASEITAAGGSAGDITSISYEKSSGSGQTNSIIVYMKNVSRSSFSGNTDWEQVTAADIVYQGSWTIPTTGWSTITLDVPFSYDGSSNLMIAVHEYTSGYTTQYFYYTTANNTVISAHSDSENPNPYSIGSFSGTTYVQSNRANVKLEITDPSGCRAPRNLTMSNITSDGADFSWSTGESETDWEVFIDETIVPDSNTIGTAVTDTFYTFTGLNANTPYNAYVRSYCSTEGTYSPWRTIAFRTACDNITTLPFTENFDTYGTGDPSYPTCWYKINTYSSNRPYINTTHYEGVGSLYFYAGTSGTYNIAITPLFDASIPINTLQATFMYRATYATDRLIVGVMEDPTDASTFVPVETIQPESSVTTWVERTVSFENYTGTGQYIAFKNDYTSTSTYAYMDNLIIETIPSCAKPSSVHTSNVTATTVDVDWTASNDQYAWEVVVVPTGTAVTDGTPESASTHPYTVTGLDDQTTYDVYVRANCGSEYSPWSFPTHFTTDPHCSSPLNVTVSQVAGASALVSWNPAQYGATSYTVEYSVAGQDSWNMQVVDGNEYLISGLEPATAYEVMVYSNCDLGTADTVERSFTTNCLVGGNLQIGEGTSTSSYLPDYTYYNYAYSQQIYLASEMNGPAEIHSISFNLSSVGTPNRTIKIYLMHTSSTSNSWLNPSTAQLVYDNSIVWTTGWNTINFTTPFQYNGADNLAVICVDITGSYSTSNSYYCHTTSSALSRYVYNDGSPYSLPPTDAGSTTTSRSNIIFGVPCDSLATCVAPNVIVTDVTYESITLDWAPGYAESSWELEYSTDNSTWTSMGSVSTHPYELNSLDANTKYYIRLRSDCGSEYSNWTTVSARTACTSVDVPYTENFDSAPASGAGNMVYCWTRGTNSSTAYPYTSNSYHHSGTYSTYFYGASSYYSYIASPQFDDNVQMDNLQVRFWAYKTSAAYYIQVGIMEDPNDYSTFVQVGQDITPSATSTWELFEVNTDNYTGTGRYIAFRIPMGAASYMYIDDIEVDYIPFCAHVTDIHTVANSVTATSADIAWTAGGDEAEWQVVYGPAGSITDPDLEAADVVYTPEISLANLSGSTLYDVYVKAVCASEGSIWMQYSFRTACGEMSAFPFTENFDNMGSGSSIYPNCWARSNTYSTSTSYPYVSTSYHTSGNASLYFYCSTSTYNLAILPPVDVTTNPINTLMVSFMMRSTSAITSQITVGVMTDPTNPNSFTPVEAFHNTATGTFEYMEAMLSPYTGNGQYIALKLTNTGSTYSVYIDDITVDLIPGCPRPRNVVFSNITSEGASVNWTPYGTESAWDVVVVPAGHAVTEGTPELVTSRPYTITGLDDETAYDVYVRAACDNGDNSDWSIAGTFTTTPLCSSPVDVNVSQIVGTSALVSWSAALYGATGYTVEYTETGQNNWTTAGTTDATAFMLSGLNPSTPYTVRVTSDCPNGTASPVQASFTTGCLVGGAYQIGNGTSTTSYFPEYCLYNYSYTQQIYLASELNGAAPISSIAFEASTIDNANRHLKIYLMHTTAASSAWLNASTATLVYDATPTLVEGWNTFNFTTPFQYNGTDNLAVIVIDATGSWSGTNYFTCHTTSQELAHYEYQDDDPYSINTIPDGSGTSSTSTSRNNVRFGMPCDDQATCVAPNAYIAEVTSESITVDWAPGYTETAWELEYSTDQTNWTSEGAVTAPYELDNLNADTRYYIRLRSDCGSEYSNWVTLNVRTACADVTVPYMQNFDDAPASGSGNMVTCWTRNSNYTSTLYPYTSSSYHHSGTYSVYFYGTSSYYSYIASPRFADEVDMDNLQISFWAYKTSAAYNIEVGIMSDPDDYNTFVQIGQTLSPTATSTWELFEVNTDSYTGNGRYVAFRIPANITSYMYIDDINIDNIPSCGHVTNIHTVGAVTTSTAELTWTAGGSETEWEVVYGVAGTITNPETETPETAYTNSIQLTNLTGNTAYDVYVRAICSDGGTSTWLQYTFRTACDEITTLPYVDNFDTYGTGTTIYPPCWGKINTYSSDRPYINATHYAGVGSMYFYAGTSGTYNIAITPLFDASIPINTLQATFMYRSTYATDMMIVGVMSSPTDASTFVPVDTIYPDANYTTWVEREVAFNHYTGTGQYIAFKNMYTSTYCYGYIDELSIDLIPSCPKPQHIHVVDATINSIELGWTEVGSATSWEIAYGAPGFDPDGTDASYVTATSNPFTVGNLNNSTTYEFYVRALCSSTDMSYWSNSVSAATTMVPTDLPYTADFSDPSDAWVLNNGSCTNYWVRGTVNNDAALFVTDNGTTPNYTISSTSVVAAQKLFTVGTNDTITITFDVQVQGEGSYDYMKLFLAPASQQFPASTSAPGSGDYGYNSYSTYAYDFYSNGYGTQSSYHYIMNMVSGTVHVVAKMPNPNTYPTATSTALLVFAWKNDPSVGTQPPATITNLTVTADGSGPVITDPTVTTTAASAITQNSATLNATITNPDNVTITAKGFEWKLTNGGTYTQIAGTGTGNSFTANLTGLTANTGYTFKAFITFNGSTVYGSEQTFTTSAGQSCNVPTNLTATATAYNSADVTWTAGGSETSWNLQYKAASAANWSNSIPVTATNYQLTGLTAQTAYQVRVQAVCGNNQTSDWATANFTTPAEPVDPCDAPTNLQFSNITENTATVTWTPGGNETAWNVQYKLQSASQWQEANVQQPTFEIEGLTANSTYDVRVKAICAADNQSTFLTGSFTTEGTGIDNITLAQSISLMPNPADNYIELRIKSNVEVKEAVVYNAFGQMIQTVQLTENHARIDLSNMAAGMYFVRVNGEGVTATKKFIKR